jgi:hypothetical protein
VHLLPGQYEKEFCFSESNGQVERSCLTTAVKRFDLTEGQKENLTYGNLGNSSWQVIDKDLSAEDVLALGKDIKRNMSMEVK